MRARLLGVSARPWSRVVDALANRNFVECAARLQPTGMQDGWDVIAGFY